MIFKTVKVHDLRGSLPRQGQWSKRAINKIKIIAVHHTAGNNLPDEYDEIAAIENWARYHQRKDWGGGAHAPTVAYHFMIGRSGTIYWCNDIEDRTWHANYANDIALSVCLHGNLTTQEPSQAQINALRDFLKELCEQHPEFPADHNDVYGHGELKGKTLALSYGMWTDFGNYTQCAGSATALCQEFRKTKDISKADVPQAQPNRNPTEVGEFLDLGQGSWYEPYAKALVDTGIMRGFDDGMWRPAQPVTRAELAKVVIGALMKQSEVLEAYEKHRKK